MLHTGDPNIQFSNASYRRSEHTVLKCFIQEIRTYRSQMLHTGDPNIQFSNASYRR